MQIKYQPIIAFLLIVVPFLYSCKGKEKKEEVKQVIIEWIGKQILFPSEFQCDFCGKDTSTGYCSELFNNEYKILLYVDSIGCTDCKLRLPVWRQLMREVDSLYAGKVSFLFFFHPKEKRELQYLLKFENMKYPVFIDLEDKINQLNQFPTQMEYQCFLLDKDNKSVD
jgi:hypothetical protein